MTQPILGAIADDLTGGVELAAMLVSRGVRTHLGIDAGAPIDPAAEAVVLALKSRLVARDAAVAATEAALARLRQAGARRIFFKYCATFDSTPAGNIGPCADLLLDRLGADITLFCPAFCEIGRTVYQGHLFVGDRLLSESPKRFDPVTPMTDPDLVRVLQAQSVGRVGLVPHEVVRRGAPAIGERVAALRAAGRRLAIVDAITEADLAAIAAAAADLAVMTGNSSVAAHLPPVWRARGWLAGPGDGAGDGAGDPIRLPAVAGHAAVLAGSCAERTAEQLQRFAAHRPVLALDLAAACGGADVVAPALAWAASGLAAGPVAIATTAGPKEVAALQEAFGREVVAARAEAVLAEIAAGLVGGLGVRRMVVAGGETAGAVLRGLGAETLTIGPYEGPGVARLILEGRPRSRAPEDVALVLKSGKLGPPGMFLEVLDEMRRPLERAPLLGAEGWPP